MTDISNVDFALLSFLGVNGRAFSFVESASDPRDLIAQSSLRPKKPMSDDELAQKRDLAEGFRVKLLDFEDCGGQIIGARGPFELGALTRASPPPLCAYVRGNEGLLQAEKKVAIVGTRDASPKGLARAFDIAGRLSEKGLLVVSGGANGIDLAAHRGAVERGFETLAILGDPLLANGDERPHRLRALDPALMTTVTLFGPWVKPSRALFVARNQFVAALCDAILIVEGRTNSGTLHTANYANKMGIPVWVVPGEPYDEMAQASNWLLERGLARAFVNLDYFLSTLDPKTAQTPKKSEIQMVAPRVARPKVQLSAAQESLLKLFGENEGRLTVDELAEKCETPVSALQQELLMLELMGALKKQGTEFVIL